MVHICEREEIAQHEQRPANQEIFSAAGPLRFNLYKPYKYQNKSQEKGVCFIVVVNTAVQVSLQWSPLKQI